MRSRLAVAVAAVPLLVPVTAWSSAGSPSPASAATAGSSPARTGRSHVLLGWTPGAVPGIPNAVPTEPADYALRFLPGNPWSLVAANASGEILGASGGHLTLWDAAGDAHPVPDAGDGTDTARDLADDGTVVGYLQRAKDVPFGVRRDGSLLDLPVPAGVDEAEARFAPANGDVVGVFRRWSDEASWTAIWHADGRLEQLPSWLGEPWVVTDEGSGVFVSPGERGQTRLWTRSPEGATAEIHLPGPSRYLGVDSAVDTPGGHVRLILSIGMDHAVRYLDPSSGTLLPDGYTESPPEVSVGFFDGPHPWQVQSWVWDEARGKRVLPPAGGRRTEVFPQVLPARRLWGQVDLTVEGGARRGVVFEPLAGTTTTSVPVTADTYVNGAAPGARYPAASSLAVGGAADYRAYLHADVPPSAPGRRLIAARLRLHTSTQAFAGSGTWLTVRRAAPFAEDGATWRTTSAGGVDIGGIGPTGPDRPVTAALDVSWLGDGGGPLDLSVVVAYPYGQPVDSLWFWSREYPRAASRPTLELIYR